MNPTNPTRGLAVAILAAAGAAAAHAGTKSSVSYIADFYQEAAYLVDWNTANATAHVTTTNGQSDGTYTDDGTQRLVRLATPITTAFDSVDECSLEVVQTTAVTQLVFRPVSGTPRRGSAQVVEIGTITVTGGCAPGMTPYGSPGDPGAPTALLDMADRASIADLVPGAQLAGMSETPTPATGYEPSIVAQVATFGAGNVTFQSTGDVVPRATKAGWIVLDFGSFRYGYTRLTRNATSGVEAWLGAPWVGGAPASVHNLLMVEPKAGAGFGTHKQAARSWLEGLFRNADPLVYWDLYKDGTGAFDQRALADGSLVFSQPLTWKLVGADMQIKRSSDFSVSYRQRLWVPLANYGANHFVMESDDLYGADGTFLGNVIPPRVDYFVDRGPAVRPALAARGPAASTARTAGTRAE